MRTDLFDFDLPDDRIALEPTSPRDAARLLVVHPYPHAPTSSPRRRGPTQDRPHAGPACAGMSELEDRVVRDLPELLRPGDALVFNDTRVIRAALQGERVRGDNRAQIVLQPAQARRREPLARVRAAGQAARRGRPHPLRP